MFDFQILDRLNDDWGDQQYIVADPAQSLQRIQQHCGGSPQQRGGPTSDHLSIRQLDRRCGQLIPFSPFQSRRHASSVFHADSRLAHQEFHLHDGFLIQPSLLSVALGIIIPADDLLTGGFLTGLVIHNAFSRHIYAHICGRFIRAFPKNTLKGSVKHRKYFYIPVIVYRRGSIGLQMKGIDHIDII